MLKSASILNKAKMTLESKVPGALNNTDRIDWILNQRAVAIAKDK